MEKREKNLPLAHPIELRLMQLLDLDDHLATPPEIIGFCHYPGTSAGKYFIVDTGPLSCFFLHQDGVARSPYRLNGRRCERDVVLVFFDFPRDSNYHAAPPYCPSTRRKALSASAITAPSLARITLPSRMEKRPFFCTSRPSIRSGSPTGAGSRYRISHLAV